MYYTYINQSTACIAHILTNQWPLLFSLSFSTGLCWTTPWSETWDSPTNSCSNQLHYQVGSITPRDNVKPKHSCQKIWIWFLEQLHLSRSAIVFNHTALLTRWRNTACTMIWSCKVWIEAFFVLYVWIRSQVVKALSLRSKGSEFDPPWWCLRWWKLLITANSIGSFVGFSQGRHW